ncbi:MAG TPA: hypothetical protein VF574_12040 [Allosphingosinicella sp.]|jgi:pimeloyl-ACP methyl ester carboxylesterase
MKRRIFAAAAILAVAALSAPGSPAAPGRTGGTAVGHRLDLLKDQSRSWGSDEEGAEARPIFVDRWYPAVAGRRPTRIGDYVLRKVAEPRAQQVLARYVNPRDRAIVEKGLAEGDPARAAQIFEMATQAWSGARSRGKEAPSLLLVPDWTLSAQPNALLGERLAGRGFSVASPLSLGRNAISTLFSKGSLADAEAQARDIEQVLSSSPAGGGITLIAHGQGAVAALLVASRDRRIERLALLNPPQALTDGSLAPLIDPYEIRADILALVPKGSDTGRWDGWMKYAGLEVLEVAVSPTEWTDYPALQALAAGKEPTLPPAIWDALIAFLEKSDAGGPYLVARRRPDLPDELGWIGMARREGFEVARDRLLKARAAFPDLLPFRQKEMLRVTRDRTSGNWDLEGAIEGLRLNALLNPDAISSYDSLADAYIAAGRPAAAAAAYRAELDALPRDPSLTPTQREAERVYLEKRLAELSN